MRLWSLYHSTGDTAGVVLIAVQIGQNRDRVMRNFRFIRYDCITMEPYEATANGFLELASQQRLAILLSMQDGPVKVSTIAKDLDATVPEVYRNFERMVKAGLILKNPDGGYGITSIGKILCSQVPLIGFLSSNKKYFQSHDFSSLPSKYIQRFGSLEKGQYVKGFVKIMERWKEIYSGADKYIYNILFEVPYTPDLIEPLAKKVSSGVKLCSIFSESAIISKERKQVFDKLGFKELIQQGKIERKMQENVSVIVILNEKESGVMFPVGGEVDMSEGFFSSDKEFHEWCLDYFLHCWESAGPFRETKLKE